VISVRHSTKDGRISVNSSSHLVPQKVVQNGHRGVGSGPARINPQKVRAKKRCGQTREVGRRSAEGANLGMSSAGAGLETANK